MKRVLLLAAICLAFSSQLFSQSKPYNVVFDITTSDTAVHQRVIRWINLIINANPDAKIEVVFYGKSLDMVVQEKSSVASDVMKLATEKKVNFVVCQQAMKVHNIEKNQLLPGVRSVPDGIYELVTKQAEGFGYIKVVN